MLIESFASFTLIIPWHRYSLSARNWIGWNIIAISNAGVIISVLMCYKPYEIAELLEY